MPYIGKQPLTGAYQLCDTITTSATATYNLLVGGSAVIPGSAQNCIVSLNGVIQAPVNAFTVSGSTITFASTLSATDVIDFILILGNVFDIGTPTNGAVTNSSLNSNVITGQTAETSVAGGDLVLLYDDSASALKKMTRTNFVSGLNNTPIFHAYRSTAVAQVIPNNTYTVGELQAEFYDTDSAFDTSTYRFTVPTGKSGIYFFFFGLAFTSSVPDAKTLNVGLMKNGGIRYMSLQGATTGVAITNAVLTGSYTEQLSDGDYIQLVVYQNSGTTQNMTGGSPTGNVGPFLAGFRVLQ